MKGVLDYPFPGSKRLELNFPHVEMGLLTRQATTVPITYASLQAEGTSELDGLPCNGYIDTSTSSFLCCPR
jgi:hypothetical protein